VEGLRFVDATAFRIGGVRVWLTQGSSSLATAGLNDGTSLRFVQEADWKVCATMGRFVNKLCITIFFGGLFSFVKVC
jgi:hypothetical protein